MDLEELKNILERPENETLDFKETNYDLSSPIGRNSFVLDVLSLANTPRDTPSHLVIGVKWSPDAGTTVVGLLNHTDDALYQDAVGEGRVAPHPRFTAIPMSYEDKRLDIIEIPCGTNGPYTPTKDFPGLQAGAVYYRMGTKNTRAVGDQHVRIVNWFHSRLSTSSPPELPASWRDFLQNVDTFFPGRHYILAVDRIDGSSTASIDALGLVPWRAVFDFDPNSEESGFLFGGSNNVGNALRNSSSYPRKLLHAA